MIMKGSTDSAPNHTERRIIYLDWVNVKNSSVFSTMNTRQRRISSLYCDEVRYWKKNPAMKINDSSQLFKIRLIYNYANEQISTF